MITVVCVLRSGGPTYTPEWVWALRRGLNRHLAGYEFVCLTDVAGIGMWGAPLLEDWPGWWAKLEAFRPDLFPGSSRVLYLDLDTLPVGDLSEISSYAGPLAMLSDFNRPKLAQSGIMAWTPGEHTTALWEAFAADPRGHMRRFRGDGEFLHAHCRPDRLQELYPGQIRSYKKDHCTTCAPNDTRLICFHGKPKVMDLPVRNWARQSWESM